MSGRVNLLNVGTVTTDEAFRATEVAANIQYLGWAVPGTLTSASTWKLCKVTYDATDTTVISITWPAGSRSYAYEYDERASYSYT